MNELLRRRRIRALRRLVTAIVVTATLFAGVAFVVQGPLLWPADLLWKVDSRPVGPAGQPSEALRAPPATAKALPEKPPTRDMTARVVKVLDGDTVEVISADGDEIRIRLHGIDAPEMRQRSGPASRRALLRMVGGRTIGLDIYDQDSYGRLVAVLFRGDLNVNEEMIRRGHAWWYRRYASTERGFRLAEAEAREARRGLWRDADPVAPWNWRHR